MAHGLMTSSVARTLSKDGELHAFHVLFDHGSKDIDPPEKLGKIRAWYGPNYSAATILADLDIAIVSPIRNKVIALIEIEETDIKPKVILGDALAFLLGDDVKFQGKQDLDVGPWTTLIIMACGLRREHQGRVAYLEHQVNQLRTALSSRNAQIGRVVVAAFQDELDLMHSLRLHIGSAIEEFKKELEFE